MSQEEVSETTHGSLEDSCFQPGGHGPNARCLDLDFFKSQGPHLMATAGSDGAVRALPDHGMKLPQLSAHNEL